LDHIPTSAAEHAFEFLHDFAVAAHRAVKALQVTVDDKNQVVEFFAGGQRNGTEAFRFITLAIAQKCPDFAITRRDQATRFHIANKPRLINGLHRAQTHRYGWELPVVWH